MNVDAKTIVHKLQHALREDKQQHIELRLKENPSAYDSPRYADYKSEPGWNIITNGYMERNYTSDRVRPNIVNVFYVAPGASNELKTNENMYDRRPIYNRTQLMTILKNSGYKKPLILDFSCGGFSRKFGFTPQTQKEKRALAKSLGVAGGKTRRKRYGRVLRRVL
jgi:hypothetical protein